MKPDWACEEKVTALAIGCVGIAALDGGAMATGAMGAAGLLGLWGKAKLKDGPGSEKLLKNVRKQLRAGFEEWAKGHAGNEADIRAADLAMEKHLADCVPPIEDLAKTTYDDEDFPAYATRLIVGRLAQKNGIFSETSDIRVPAARDFALLVVRTALSEAKNNDDFMKRLVGEVVLLIPQHLQRIEGKIDDLPEAMRAVVRQELAVRFGASFDKAGDEAEGLREQIEELELKFVGLASKISEKVDDPNDAALILDENIDIYLEMRAERERGSNLGDASDEAFERVMALIEAQEYAAALAQGEIEYIRLEDEERQVIELVAARKLRLARQNQNSARLELDANKVAYWMHKENKNTLDGRPRPHEIKALWADSGRFFDSGTAFDLDVAIEFSRWSIMAEECNLEQAMAYLALGKGLLIKSSKIGVQASTDLLSQAIKALRSALLVYEQHDNLEALAVTKLSLAAALSDQGFARNSTIGDVLLVESISECNEVIEIIKNENFSRLIDEAKERIAVALTRRGILHGHLGVNFFEKALSKFSEIIETRSSTPHDLDEASLLMSKGGAEYLLGCWKHGKESIDILDKALTTFSAAADLYSKNQRHFSWALARQNSGYALEILAARDTENEESHAQNALVAIRDCLTVFTPEDYPSYYKQACADLFGVEKKIAGLRASEM